MYKHFNYENGNLVKNEYKLFSDSNDKVPIKIAHIIELLNEKNYKTIRSNSGNAFVYNCIETLIDSSLEVASLEEIEEYLKLNNLSEDYLTENGMQISRICPDRTVIRIDFDKGYNFKCLPDDFYPQFSNKKYIMDNMAFKFYEKGYIDIDKETLNNYRNNRVTKILRAIDLFDRDPKDVQKDLDDVYNMLYEWVKNLDDNI